jgi:hypothetical protein
MLATNAPSRTQLERHIKAARILRAETVAHELVRIMESASSAVRQVMRRPWERADSADPQRWTGIRQ